MRYQFNLMGFAERVAAGELEILIVLRDRPQPDFEDLHDAESQIVHYRLRVDLDVLAECHRYVFIRGERRGRLAASGIPDPKWLLVADEEWNASHTDEEACDDCDHWRRRVSATRPRVG
jgi:hypothetical protein